jgi:hypothetical protein
MSEPVSNVQQMQGIEALRPVEEIVTSLAASRTSEEASGEQHLLQARFKQSRIAVAQTGSRQDDDATSSSDKLPHSDPPPIVVKQESELIDHGTSGLLLQLHHAQDLVWKGHLAAMKRYFVAKDVPNIISSTKIAIQKKGFRSQAENEIQVAEAKQTANEHASTGAKACITDFGGT